ncbi:MAG: (2Fe-2S)-binding protein [Peptococcaceae bacterium]|nr:(2Fe-2S)-binding protein [Peptococcaceae bacterium]
MKKTITMTVNGQIMKAEVEPRTLLIDCLRDQLGLSGAKVGCVVGKCGACTIILNGLTVKSCMMFAVQADGAEIMTIEGLAGDGELHPMQQAFTDKSAVQCGFCTSGMVLTATQLAKDHPNASEEEIKDAIGGHICRCTGYVAIVDAIKEGCKRMSEQQG